MQRTKIIFLSPKKENIYVPKDGRHNTLEKGPFIYSSIIFINKPEELTKKITSLNSVNSTMNIRTY